jgi:16S rRNA processing protein RimM
MLVSFDGYDQREQIAAFSNELVQVRSEDRPILPEGEYYHHQLIGANVIDDEARHLGSLVDILITGANDVFVIRSEDNKEILLPAIDSVILEIDLNKKMIHVHIPPGLMPGG